MSLPGYDAWLERPYQEMYALEAQYENFLDRCHEDGIEPTDEDWEQYLEDGTYPYPEDDEPDPDKARDDFLEARYEEQFEMQEDDVPW